MAATKASDLLGLSDSDNDDIGGYDSENEIQKGGRSASRRKLSDDEDDQSDIEQSQGESDAEKDEDNGSDEEEEIKTKEKPKKAVKIKSTRANDLPDITKPLTKKNLVATEEAVKKSGVVYLSRIPPFMKPAKLRSLLEPYGTINRIFLAPEDPTAHARRVKAGGNKKKTYTEGWVEFTTKKQAKTTCELLNAQIIGGKKGSYYHDDLWNLLYLNGFKWHNLTEQIASENAERTSRMRAEINKTTRENKEFVRNVEHAKMLDTMQAKAKNKKRKTTTDGDDTEPSTQNARTFKQTPLAKKAKATDEPSERVNRVLSKIF
ncbi:hypothetical protein Golomagni_08023 [Golovinomyces magnicellulatus]|nr:hypothetical protein Golomagni_08023 [Golovinomyces magnicellulatus]